MVKSKLHGLKDKAREQGKRQVMQQKEKLPTEDQIVEKLKETGCQDPDKRRLESKYNKLKNTINKIKSALEGAAKAIAGLEKILSSLNKLIKILDTIIKVLNVILKVFKIIIKIAKIVVKFLGGTGTGGLIDILSRAIVKAEYTIGKWVQAVGRCKEFIKKMLKKYIDPITKQLKKAMKIIKEILGGIDGLMTVLEMLYMFMMSKCAISGDDNILTSDTNRPLTDGSGVDEGNKTNASPLNTGTKADQLGVLYDMLKNNSPEELIAKMALRRGGDNEYIRYIRNARFEIIGYERFNAAINSIDSTRGTIYPTQGTTKELGTDAVLYRDSKFPELPEFPDLVRGNKKNDILTQNLKDNPDGPQPNDENIGSY